MRPDATPMPGPHRPGPAAGAPRYMRELARVGEIDLVEGLGPERLAALSRLAEEARAVAERRRRRLVALVAGTALALAAALAVALRHA